MGDEHVRGDWKGIVCYYPEVEMGFATLYCILPAMIDPFEILRIDVEWNRGSHWASESSINEILREQHNIKYIILLQSSVAKRRLLQQGPTQ